MPLLYIEVNPRTVNDKNCAAHRSTAKDGNILYSKKCNCIKNWIDGDMEGLYMLSKKLH